MTPTESTPPLDTSGLNFLATYTHHEVPTDLVEAGEGECHWQSVVKLSPHAHLSMQSP